MAAHRYWRLRIDAGNYGNTPYIDQLQFLDSMGFNVVPFETTDGSFASSVSEYSSILGAFDDPYTNYWEADPGAAAPHHVGWDFGAGGEVEVTGIGVYSYSDMQPVDFALEWSDDGTTWTEAWSIVGYPVVNTYPFVTNGDLPPTYGFTINALDVTGAPANGREVMLIRNMQIESTLYTDASGQAFYESTDNSPALIVVRGEPDRNAIVFDNVTPTEVV